MHTTAAVKSNYVMWNGGQWSLSRTQTKSTKDAHIYDIGTQIHNYLVGGEARV